MIFTILGPVEARHADGTPVAVGGPRVRGLLALLLLDAGRLVPTERLVDGLYGEHPPTGAANALQSQVSRLRRGLGDSDLVEFHPAGYRLAVDPQDVDAHRFERLARDGQRALAAGDHAGAADLLREALDLWRGPALADVTDAPFAEGQAARLAELRAAAVEDRAEADLALGGHREVVARLRELVAEYPLRERARGQLMRALSGSGRQAEALAEYEDTRRLLAEELGADPSAELTAVHVSVLRGEIAAPSRQRLGLPAQLTSFVGRAEELDRIAALLAGTRLVTLTGPGGAGKTRLAIEASGLGRGEACFVDLAPLGDGAEVPQAVLAALGLREGGLLPSAGGPADPTERLVAALTDRPLLLILDNCEHVIDHAARLAHRLLGACPGLRVLATSREALGITGESLCPVRQLPLPPPGTPAGQAVGYPAVRLFVDRATAVRPDFALDDTVDGVLRICAALDGSPLAIELAAARLRSLTVAEVDARLDDRFRLLSRGSRTAAARHQTLRAVVEWSWDLLSDAEKTLARRLTVFNGGLTLEAAAAVCGLPAEDVDELLADLADKSLIEDAGGRYRMLDTIRVFCAERLAESGEEERFRRAHAGYFLDLARRADTFLRGHGQLTWLARLAAEHPNTQAAVRWAARADPALALHLVAALSWDWWLRGLRGEGAPLAGEILDAVGTSPPADLHEEYVLCVLNTMAVGTGQPVLVERLERAQELMAGIDHTLKYPFTTVLWALAAGPHRTDEGAYLRQLGSDPWSLALYRLGMGYQHQFGGNLAESEPEFEAGLAAFRELGDRWGMANTLDPLALLAEARGDHDRSIALMGEALELVEQLGALEDLADLLGRRGDSLVRRGDLDAAGVDYERSEELIRRAGAPEKLAGAHGRLGDLARYRGDLPAARRLFETALRECTTATFGGEMARAVILTGLGRVQVAEGAADEARTTLGQALRIGMDHPNMLTVALVVEALAGVALLDGDPERAALLLGTVVPLRGASLAGDRDVAGTVAATTELLGEDGFAAAHARGAGMTRDEVLALLRR
ncbi:SARP family transcriptional regulator [Longispora fulva]|uniref:Putative ATPase/DNA-binding SARP family transcriptional activator n=1 Tax=Longispora fulva TaxID=619741 RepID=A0A8J7GW82_9ACTN|nr:BTAD domain-containing putative transcriptional regulator [Longispora fulva]MBG6138736.1 putative ATPase/DNA-binding SARP family transcriptional activator [Longispora fulva]GIG58230.1 SARP family transcriptional regulator [Longispora fulva]